MPGWHEATRKFQETGRLQTVGIIQEQHPDRARLFMQWKQMHWPILVDSLNLLGISVVPLTLLVDEHGIIRQIQPRLDDARQIIPRFLESDFPAPEGDEVGLPDRPAGQPSPEYRETLRRRAEQEETSAAWRAFGDALILWGEEGDLDRAIRAYRRSLELDPEDADAHFRLGVVHRRRYDSGLRRPDDFQVAVRHWQQALQLEPNNYIWRRRIQQYGPRLDKPYSFYDWVETARSEIRARGDTPVPLQVEPGGAEIAHPAPRFEAAAGDRAPDPEGRIFRDPGRFVRVDSAVVPGEVGPGKAARVHLVFRPDVGSRAHWNNEVGGLTFWVDPPEGWSADPLQVRVAPPPRTVSEEARTVEFEVQVPEDADPGRYLLSGYAVYYVCEDVYGACLYRRQDVEVELTVGRSAEASL